MYNFNLVAVNCNDTSMSGKILKAYMMGQLTLGKSLASVFQEKAGLSDKKGLRLFRGHSVECVHTGSCLTVTTAWTFPVIKYNTKDDVFNFIEKSLKISWEDWMQGHFTDQDQKKVKTFMASSVSRDLCIIGLNLIFSTETSFEFRVVNRLISSVDKQKETETIQELLNPKGKKSHVEFNRTFSVLKTGFLYIRDERRGGSVFISGLEVFEDATAYVKQLIS